MGIRFYKAISPRRNQEDGLLVIGDEEDGDDHHGKGDGMSPAHGYFGCQEIQEEVGGELQGMDDDCKGVGRVAEDFGGADDTGKEEGVFEGGNAPLGQHAGEEGHGGEEELATEPGKKDGTGGDGKGDPREGLDGEEAGIGIDDGFDLWVDFGMRLGRHMIFL